MSSTITTAMQLTLNIASSVNLTVTDQGGTGTVTVGTGYFRVFLAPVTGSAGTSATSPSSLVGYLTNLLNTHAGGSVYTFAVNSGGFITLHYSGTGTASITDSASVILNTLGFGGTSLSIPTGTTVTATYHPTHTMYSSFRDADTNKMVRPQRRAARDMPDGSNYSFRDNMQRVVQRFNSKSHPKTWAEVSTTGSSITAFLPTDTTRFKTPNATPGIAPPWSVVDTFAAGDQNFMAGAFSTFQQIITGSVTTFDTFYFTSEFLKKAEWSRPTVADWYALIDVSNIEISWFGTGTF